MAGLLKNKPELYSDLRLDFAMSPANFDVMRVTNEASITQSLTSLILTNRGECVTDMNKGCDVSRYMFHNITPATLILMKKDIENTIRNYEPRIELIGVDVLALNGQHEVQVTVIYLIDQDPAPNSLTVIVKRER